MNAFDYFFENYANSGNTFLVGTESASFSKIYQESLGLADLIHRKIGQNKNILLLSENNLFFIVAYLGILKSGNTCVPLDPKIEPKNLDFIVDSCKPSMVIIDKKEQSKVESSNLPMFLNNVLEGFKNVDLSSISVRKIETQPEQLAEIIFTSGSTGVPKGVCLSHKNLIANTKSIVEYLNLSEQDRMLVVLPFYYCYGLSLLHTHLRVGGSIVLNNSFFFLGKVINDLKNYECTGFAGVPSHFQMLLRKSRNFKNTEFPALKYVTQAGGKLSTVFIDEFKESFPKTIFYVMYGQTEATARLSYLPPEKYDEKKGSMGKGIPGVKLMVADENLIPVKPGETGEIYAKGDNIMLGYLNDEEATKATIIDGWLKTGDLATVDEDGYIFIVARKKEILKVAGKRVSPKEIEEVILKIPDVVDCTIKGIDDIDQGEAIFAKVVVRDINNGPSINQIKEHCSKNLVLYKVPKEIEIVSNVEFAATGKKLASKN